MEKDLKHRQLHPYLADLPGIAILGMAGAPQANLNGSIRVNELLIHRPPEWSAMSDLRPQHGVRHIVMGVHMNQSHWTMAGLKVPPIGGPMLSVLCKW